MNNDKPNIDQEIIDNLGLCLTKKHVNAGIAADARVFEYPHLDNVFIMGSDLYGNPMPKNSCFLVFLWKERVDGKTS